MATFSTSGSSQLASNKQTTGALRMKAIVSLRVTTIALAALLIVTVGCSKTPGDSQIAADIQTRLSADSGLQGKQLVVQAANGSVTLSGTVDNDAERDAAAKYASSEPGVKQVVNNLQVSPSAMEQPASMPAPAPMPPAQESPKPLASSRHHHRDRDRNIDRNSDTARIQKSDSDNNSMPMASNNVPPPPMSTPEPAQSAAPMPPPPPPPPQKVTIPSGTSLSVRLIDPIDSETAQEGQTFTATLNSALSTEGDVAVPAGYEVEGHVVTVHSAGKFAGQSLLVLQLDRIKVAGKRYDIQTNQYEKKASSRSTNTAEKVGGGAVLGAIIGGLAGGGKGAGIGAAAGAGLGGGVQAATKSKQIKLPSETVLNFTLQAPLTVTKTSEGPHPGRQRLDNNQDISVQH
jgi:hypothetical protein